MNLEHIKKIALKEMPIVDVDVVKDSYRHNVIDSMVGDENIGIELGVAEGKFSARMVNSGKFKVFFGVDVYADLHDTEEYKLALQHIGLLSNYRLLRMTFDDALGLFEDGFFDFIYVDGFAHTGQDGGRTLIDWYQKLKVGGIFAGDDYHDDWPLVKWAVNHFVSQTNMRLHVTDKVEDEPYCQHPSWFIQKDEHIPAGYFTGSKRLSELAIAERDRIHKMRMPKTSGLQTVRNHLLELLGLRA